MFYHKEINKEHQLKLRDQYNINNQLNNYRLKDKIHHKTQSRLKIHLDLIKML